ncbi:MAG: IclR family transcriptional regulator [Peptococcaceae bacterium]
MCPENNIIKALKLLDYFTIEQPRHSLNDLCRLSTYPKGTVHRLLASLEDCGFLKRCHEYNDDRRYQLGIKVFELGIKYQQSFELNKVALPYMKELKKETNEAIHFTIRVGNEAIYVEKIDTDHPIRLYTKKGRRTPLYAGASGRILLAYLSGAEIEKILAQPLENFTDKTPISREDIREKIEFAKANGYSLSIEELCPDSWEIAVPVFNTENIAVASLSVAGPLSRFNEELAQDYIARLKKHATLLTSEIGSMNNFSI